MDKQQIVVQSRYSQLNGEVKTLLGTNEFNCEFETIVNKKQRVVYRGTTLTIDEETYKTATSDAGFFFARYDAENETWKDDQDNSIDLATYGITVNGNAIGGDVFIIFNNDGNITNEYYEFMNLFREDNTTFDYVSFYSSSPVEIQINKIDEGEMLKLTKTKKIEIDFDTMDFLMDINLWNYAQKDVDVNLILAKKVKNETI